MSNLLFEFCSEFVKEWSLRFAQVIFPDLTFDFGERPNGKI